MKIEKEAEAFVSEKADKGNFDVEKFGKAYFSESSMKQALVKFAEPREKRIAELEKENAELKAEIENDRDLPTVAYMQGAENQKKKDEKRLTKAKELLKQWLQTTYAGGCDNVNLGIETEQFLKEIEK